MKKLDDLLWDLNLLSQNKSLPFDEVDSAISKLKTENQARIYVDLLRRKVKPETALSDYLFRPLIEDKDFLGLRVTPQIRTKEGWVDYLIHPAMGNPIAVELKPLHKLRSGKIVLNALKDEYERLKADEKNQVRQYLRDYDYVLLTNTDDIYYFNREALVEFKPFLQEKFLMLIDDLRTNSDIWDVIRRKEDRTPRHNLDKKFFQDLKKWYAEFQELKFKPKVDKQETVVQILNKFIFLKTLEDYSLIPFNYIRRIYDENQEKWQAKGKRKVFQEFFYELNRWSYEYYDTELFQSDVFEMILPEDRNMDTLQTAIERILGFSEWSMTFGEGLAHYNYRNIDEDIFGKAYETFLAEGRKEHGIYYTPSIITEYMSQYIVHSLFKKPAEDLIEAINRDNFEQARKLTDKIISIKILDPACGSGSFLIKILRHIWSIYGFIHEKTNWSTYGPETGNLFDEPKDIAERKDKTKEIRISLGIGPGELETITAISSIMLRHIYGIDLDEKAVDVAKVNLWKEAVKLAPKCFRYSSLRGPVNHVLPNLEMNFATANTLYDMSVEETVKILSKRFKDKIQELYKLRIEYLQNPCDPKPAEQESILKNEIRQSLFKICRKKLSEIDTPPLFAPLEFFQCFFDREGNALEKTDAGFDGLIGNPPYIRIQALQETDPALVAYFKERYQSTATGNYDIYVIFVEKGLSLLNNNGRLGFILPNKFFNSKYGEPLRELIAESSYLDHIVHFGDLQIFDEATTYTCLLFLNKHGSTQFEYVRVSDLNIWRKGEPQISGTIDATKVTADEWNFTIGEDRELFEQLSSLPNKLGEVADIYVGLQTSADDVFIMTYISHTEDTLRLRSKALDTAFTFEKGLLFPIVSGKDVKRYMPLPERQFILFPYEIGDGKASIIDWDDITSNYPHTSQYLEQNREILEKREGGKVKGDRWYGYIYLKNMARQAIPKVCVPRLVDKLHAAYDDDGTHFLDNVDVGGIVFKSDYETLDLLFLLGLLNSKLLRWYFPYVSAPFRGGWLSANRQFLSQLPICLFDLTNPAENAQYEKMIGLVGSMLQLQKQKLEAKTTDIEEQIDEMIKITDHQIDAIVYKLYGLTDEEITDMEGKSI